MAPRKSNKHKASKGKQLMSEEAEQRALEELQSLGLEDPTRRRSTSPAKSKETARDSAKPKESAKPRSESLVGRARLQAAFYPKFENESSDQAVSCSHPVVVATSFHHQ